MNDYTKTYDFYMMSNIRNLAYYDCETQKLNTISSIFRDKLAVLVRHNIVAEFITKDIEQDFFNNNEIKAVLPICKSDEIILFFKYGFKCGSDFYFTQFEYLVVNKTSLDNLFDTNNEIVITRVLNTGFIFPIELKMYSVRYKIDNYEYLDSFSWQKIEKITNLTKLLYDYDYLGRHDLKKDTTLSFRLPNCSIFSGIETYQYKNKFSRGIISDDDSNILDFNIDLIKYLDAKYQNLKDKYNIAEYYYEDYIRLKFLEFKPNLIKYINYINWSNVVIVGEGDETAVDESKTINKLIRKNLKSLFIDIISAQMKTKSHNNINIHTKLDIKQYFDNLANTTVNKLNSGVLNNGYFDKYRVISLTRRQLDNLYRDNILPFYQLLVNEISHLFKYRIIDNEFVYKRLHSIYEYIVREFNYDVAGYMIAIRELNHKNASSNKGGNEKLQKYITTTPSYLENIKYGLNHLFEMEFSKFKSKLGETRYYSGNREIYGKECVALAFDNFFIATDSDISTWKGNITEADRLYVNCINEKYYTKINNIYQLDKDALYELFKSKLYTFTYYDDYILYSASSQIKFTLSNKIWITPTNSVYEGRFYFIHEQCDDAIKTYAIGPNLDPALKHLVEYNQRG